MPQQQALQADVISRPLAVVLVVAVAVALAMADGELFLIVVFFYPTLLTPCLCRPRPNQRRWFAAARRCDRCHDPGHCRGHCRSRSHGRGYCHG